MRSQLDIRHLLEAHPIAATLDQCEWHWHGAQHRLVALVTGQGELSGPEERIIVQAPILLSMPAGSAARMKLSAGSRGAVLAVGAEVLGQLAFPGHIIDALQLLSKQAPRTIDAGREGIIRISNLIVAISSEIARDEAGASDVLRHQLAIASTLLWRAANLQAVPPRSAPHVIVRDFFHLVDQHMRQHWTVADYASAIGVSVDRLSTAVARSTGQSPRALIHARLMHEAQQMIQTSTLQIAEIGVILGFDDPAYFSRFFKRNRPIGTAG